MLLSEVTNTFCSTQSANSFCLSQPRACSSQGKLRGGSALGLCDWEGTACRSPCCNTNTWNGTLKMAFVLFPTWTPLLRFLCIIQIPARGNRPTFIFMINHKNVSQLVDSQTQPLKQCSRGMVAKLYQLCATLLIITNTLWCQRLTLFSFFS